MSDAKLEKIAKLGEKGKANKLISYAGSRDAQERAAAATALGHCNTDEAYNTLITMLRDPDDTVCVSAINGLKAMGRKTAAEHVRHVYQSRSNPEIVKAGTEALGVLHDNKGN